MNELNLQIKLKLTTNFDFISRNIAIGGDTSRTVTVCWLDTLVSGDAVSRFVIRPLTDPIRFHGVDDIAEKLTDGSVYAASVNRRMTAEDVVSDILNGYCAVIIGDTAVTLETKSTDMRGVDAPKEEKVVKGGKDAFTEIMKTNLTLVRRRIRNSGLKINTVTVGSTTNTAAAVVYIEGVTDTRTVTEVQRRLCAISSGGALTSAVIERSLSDCPASPFPQIITTERSDKFCINLLEGRVGVIIDGLPVGYLAPAPFSQFFKVPEDAAGHFMISAVLTVLRYAAMVLTLLLPAFYTAVALYHQEMLPSKLMESVIRSKQAVPFPTAVEITMMLIAFELIQEAGLRLPNPVGEIVGIIGALIIGQAAVEARIVSPVVVIVIAAAGIAGTVMPSQEMAAALRIARFVLVIFAIVGGLFGVAIGVIALAYHLCSIEVFGADYIKWKRS